MMSNIIKQQEFRCPCCGKKINIKLSKSGELIITPFNYSNDFSNINTYDFGICGGDKKDGKRKL